MFLRILFFGGLIILAVCDTSLLPVFFGFQNSPSVLLIAVIIWSIKNRYEKIWPKSAAAGLVADIFLMDNFGSNILIFSFISFFIGVLAKRVILQQKAVTFLTLTSLVILGVALDFIFSKFFLWLQAPSYFFRNASLYFSDWIWISNLIRKSFFSLIVCFLIYRPFNKIAYFFEINYSKNLNK